MGTEKRGHSVTSDLGNPGLSERETFLGGGSLVPYLVILLVDVSHNWDLYSR